MTFEEFKATLKREGRDWAEYECGFEAEDETTGFRVYASGFYIEELGDADHLLYIERSGWKTPDTSLEEMEKILYEWTKEEDFI